MTSPGGRPTLDQVAERAGVGRGTVSRVINGSPQVSQRTRLAVEAAVADLGYVPNLAARALVTRRTDAVALVISESEDRVFAEPFFAGVVRGISAVVTAAGRQLRTRGLPVVLGGRPPRGYDGAYVDVDNAGGARAGVTYLLERGRRRIATITGPPDMGAGRDRL